MRGSRIFPAAERGHTTRLLQVSPRSDSKRSMNGRTCFFTAFLAKKTPESFHEHIYYCGYYTYATFECGHPPA